MSDHFFVKFVHGYSDSSLLLLQFLCYHYDNGEELRNFHLKRYEKTIL